MMVTWIEVDLTFDHTQNATTVSGASWNVSMHWNVPQDGLVKNA